jgi:hypothetical protein
MSDDSNWKPSHKIGRAGPKQNVIGSAVPIKQPYHEVWPDRILRAHARNLGLDADSVAESIRVRASNADPNKGRARWDAAFMDACRTAPGTNGSDPPIPCGDSLEGESVIENAASIARDIGVDERTVAVDRAVGGPKANTSQMDHPAAEPTPAEPSRNVAVLPSSTTLRYDEMCRSIAAAYDVDEVKDIRDKALAIEVYAKQAKNVEAERQACEIRLRAERKVGQLLKEREKAKGAAQAGTNRGTTQSHGVTASSPQTLSDLGISKPQSSRWQKLAEIPEEVFEETLAAPGPKPSTSGIIAQAQPPEVNAVCDKAMWLWGRLKDFERDGLLDTDPIALTETMLDNMQAMTRELAPRVAAWLGRIR